MPLCFASGVKLMSIREKIPEKISRYYLFKDFMVL